MTTRPVPIDTELTAIAISYANRSLIADEVLPRVAVSKENFKYLKYNLKDGLTVPNTEVGRRGQVSEMTFGAVEVTESTADHGLEGKIPQSDIDEAADNYDPVAAETQHLTNTIKLAREIRTAKLVFNPSTYVSANVKTLTGTEQFSDFEKSSPIDVIGDIIDGAFMRPTHMVVGAVAFAKLSRHPHIVKAMYGNACDKGIASPEDIARLFQLDRVLVGRGYFNASRKKDAVSFTGAWGNCISLFYQDIFADTLRGTTFGYTAERGKISVSQWEDKNIGLKGGQVVRVGEQVKEIIAANDLGYLIKDVVAV